MPFACRRRGGALARRAVALFAQGSLSIQGFGYPGGELSTRALATGGSLADFDANSPINPASLLVGNRATVYLQYDPEFRWVTGRRQHEHGHRALPALSRERQGRKGPLQPLVRELPRPHLDEHVPDTQVIGALSVPSTVTAVSAGGIADIRAAMSWTFSPRLTVGAGDARLPGAEPHAVRPRVPRRLDDVRRVPQTNTFNYSGSAVSFGVLATPIDHGTSACRDATASPCTCTREIPRRSATRKVPNRLSVSGAYDGITGTILSRALRHGTMERDARSRQRRPEHVRRDGVLGGNRDAGAEDELRSNRRCDSGIARGSCRSASAPHAVRETRDQRRCRHSAVGGTCRAGLGVAHARRSANVGLAETGWIFSVGIAIKPY